MGFSPADITPASAKLRPVNRTHQLQFRSFIVKQYAHCIMGSASISVVCFGRRLTHVNRRFKLRIYFKVALVRGFSLVEKNWKGDFQTRQKYWIDKSWNKGVTCYHSRQILNCRADRKMHQSFITASVYHVTNDTRPNRV